MNKGFSDAFKGLSRVSSGKKTKLPSYFSTELLNSRRKVRCTFNSSYKNKNWVEYKAILKIYKKELAKRESWRNFFESKKCSNYNFPRELLATFSLRELTELNELSNNHIFFRYIVNRGTVSNCFPNIRGFRQGDALLCSLFCTKSSNQTSLYEHLLLILRKIIPPHIYFMDIIIIESF
uniref:Uncharacterized protein n=1 Tax=Megaselia scalaris TaxID=36166 RepID=T1GNL6_MEGSC